MSKPKAKAGKVYIGAGKGLVHEELDAVDYADYDAQEEGYSEYLVKNNISQEKPKPKPATVPPKPPAPKPQAKPQPRVATKTVSMVEEEPEFQKGFEALEVVDDWEAAMDALDKAVSAEEEKRAAQKNKQGK